MKLKYRTIKRIYEKKCDTVITTELCHISNVPLYVVQSHKGPLFMSSLVLGALS